MEMFFFFFGEEKFTNISGFRNLFDSFRDQSRHKLSQGIWSKNHPDSYFSILELVTRSFSQLVGNKINK